MSEPRFSIVMCNYNYGKYLAEAITSVLEQDYGDFEFIIVDDGSTDLSREIIRDHVDDRIVSVFKENGGQASAFNAAFALARGELFAFLDSDDYWQPTKLRELSAVFETKTVVAVQHALELVDGNSVTLGVLHPASPKRTGVSDALEQVMRKHSYPIGAPTSGLAFRRGALDRIFPLSRRWRYCADIPLRLAFLLGPVWDCSAVLAAYRSHDSNGWWRTVGVDSQRIHVMQEAQQELSHFLQRHGCQFRPVNCLSDSHYAVFQHRHSLQLSRGFHILQMLVRILYGRFASVNLEIERTRLSVTPSDET